MLGRTPSALALAEEAGDRKVVRIKSYALLLVKHSVGQIVRLLLVSHWYAIIIVAGINTFLPCLEWYWYFYDDPSQLMTTPASS